MRIGVVGARRVRSGTGAFLARFAHDAGASLATVLGTTSSSSSSAANQIGQSTACEVLACTTWGELTDAGIDAVIIASPANTHGAYLERALEASLHVYCEKPLLWSRDMQVQAKELADAFLAKGLHLHVGTQWPFTLPTYQSLFPNIDLASSRRFSMRMSLPASREHTIAECMPHPLSLLLAVHPDPQANVETFELDDDPETLRVTFDYVTSEVRVNCTVRIESHFDPLRNMGYGWDGHLATRVRDDRGTSLRLRDEASGDDRHLPEPARDSMAAFVRAVQKHEPAFVHPGAVPGVRLLESIRTAVEDWPSRR